ncbi:MAG: hypothetical protein VX223_08910, partial [Myxococcota bacterium]|nr:hypothetical protein [Myxococcota bacterium]
RVRALAWLIDGCGVFGKWQWQFVMVLVACVCTVKGVRWAFAGTGSLADGRYALSQSQRPIYD